MITVGLTGNPNSGKTTLFNKLTGSSQRVGNWSGVTVEMVEGTSKRNPEINIVDLPGIYSLSPYSPEENVTRDFLLDHDPDLVINVIDASNLERNLYLTFQILDLQFPTVIALNMIDIAKERGMTIDVGKLSEFLGCPVVPTHATTGEGLEELIDVISKHREKARNIVLSKDIEDAISMIEKHIGDDVPDHERRWHSTKILSRDIRTIEDHPQLWNDVRDIVEEFERKCDDRSDSLMAKGRYDVIESITRRCVDRTAEKDSVTERIDAVVTHKWLGIPIFILVLFGVYLISVGTVGRFCTEWIKEVPVAGLSEWMAETLRGMGAGDPLISLVCNGIIDGVGLVISFLPQILILFLFITILEDCGYMARVCFLFDRVFRAFNLSGKSVIPLMIGSGCGVPGIMSAKTIENETDRKLTAITTTFIPCSAKLPVIAMIAGALFGGSAAVAVFAYMVGIACVLISGIILKKLRTFGGRNDVPTVFVMELPPYHLPYPYTTVHNALKNGCEFLRRAGTLILVACVAVWALSSFDWSLHYLDGDISKSILSDVGRAISWIFIPLGWGEHWEFTVATITALMSKETFIGTLGVLLGENTKAVMATMLTASAGLSLLIFNMICVPCVAAVGAMRRELGSWKLTALAALYQCSLAYAICLIVYQVGTFIATGEINIGLAFSVLVALALVLLIVVKEPFKAFEKLDGISQEK